MDDTKLTMLDYILRTTGEPNLHSEARRILSTLPWPHEPCKLCGQYPPNMPQEKPKCRHGFSGGGQDGCRACFL